MAALYGRALARDFLDINAVLASGRYSTQQLLQLAQAADTGFDHDMFASALAALEQISDAALTAYGIDAEAIQAVRTRFAEWRGQLAGDVDADSAPTASPAQ
jgi:hypothetical protein